MKASPARKVASGKRFYLLFSVVLALVLAIPALALADVLKNDLRSTANSIVNYTAGDPAISVGYYIQPNNTCDAADGTAAVVSLSSSSNDILTNNITISPGTNMFTACGEVNKKFFSFSSESTLAPGDYVIKGTVVDEQGFYNTDPATFTLRVSAPADTTPPTVSTINRTDSSPTNASSANWAVTFSESVTGVDSSDFSLANTGLSGTPAITSVTGSGATYNVTASTGIGSGSLGLNLVDNDTIVDGTGNKLGGTGTGNGSFTGQVYTIDHTAPNSSASATVPNGTSTYASGDWSNQNVTVSLSAADNTGGSGVKEIRYTLNGSEPTTSTTLYSAAFTVSSTTTIRFRAYDNVGNIEAANSFQINIDKTAPTISDLLATSQPNAAGWHKSDVTNRFEANDTGGSGMSNACKMAFPADAEGKNVQQKTTSGEGSAVRVTSDGCTDVAGNSIAGRDSANFKIDKTAPAVAYKSASPLANASGWHKTDVTATFEATDALSGMGATDAEKTATSTATTSGEGMSVTVGSPAFTDRAGNTAAADAATSDLFKIDKTAATISGTNVVNDTWRNTNSSESFTATDNLSGLAEADQSFNVTASAESTRNAAGEVVPTRVEKTVTDLAGNVSDPRSVSARIDKTAPGITASLNEQPASSGWYNIATGAPTVSFECGDALSGVASCSAPHTLGNGTGQSYTGTAVDLAGNSASAARDNIDVDLIAPTKPQASTTPANPVPNSGGWFKDTVTVSYSGGTDSGGSGLRRHSASEIFTATGTHSYSGFAEDNAGNKSYEESGWVKVDASIPDVQPEDVNTTWRNSPLSRSFAASDTGSGLLDATNDASFTLTAATESQGPNSPIVGERVVSDKVGHSVIRRVSALIDLTKPNISASVLNNPASTGWYNLATGGPVIHFECGDLLSGIAPNGCPADHTITVEGPNEGFSASVSDRAGNSKSAGMSGLKVDLSRPAPPSALNLLTESDTGASAIDNITSDKTPSFSIRAEAGSKVELLYERNNGLVYIGSGAADSAGVATVTVPREKALADNAYTIVAKATGAAGNVSLVSNDASLEIRVQHNLAVDTVAPEVTIADAPASLVNTRSASFAFSSEAGATFQCKRDSAAFEACTSRKSYSALADGSHTFSVRAIDQAGNADPTPAQHTWTVDTAAPKGTVTINAGATYTKSTTVGLSLGANDPSSGSGVISMRFSDNGFSWSEWEPFTTSKAWTLGGGNGTKTVYAQYRDGVGNISTAQDKVQLDTIEPTVSGISPKHASIITDTTPIIRATIKDNLANLQRSSIKLYVNDVLISPTKYGYSASTDVLTYNSPMLSKGKETVTIVVTDTAGNVGRMSWYFTIK